MLYKFKSKATGDLIMLEPQGRQILKIIGKDPDPKGIIEPHDMLAAIEALRQAVVLEEEQRQAAAQAARDAQAAQTSQAVVSDDNAHAAGSHSTGHISLKQRVVPFIDMLQRAHAEGKDIVWGV
jgi:hypothetical protein